MAEKDDEFTGSLFFRVTSCPECGREVSREVVENNLSDDGQNFTCPHCHTVIDVGELE